MEDIVIRSLCKAFDGKPVLQGFSATLPAGLVSCIMAPSGGGKTTLLRILLGLEAADSGEIHGLAGLRLSAVFQEDRLLENLSPVANIRLVNPRRPRGEVLAALAAVRLSGCEDQPASGTSSCWTSPSRAWTRRPRPACSPSSAARSRAGPPCSSRTTRPRPAPSARRRS